MRKKDYLKPLREMLEGNKQHILEMIDIFLVDYPVALQGLEKQVSARDWLETEKAAHRLKSSFRVMCLEELVSFTDRIEKNARNQSNWVEILNIVETIKSAARQPIDFFTKERQELRKKLGASGAK